MARMRYVKPTFWTDSRMVRLSLPARLFYIGTWNFAMCDKGHLEDDPVQLKMQIFPADNIDVKELMAELLAAGRLVRVTDGDETWLQIVKLDAHQKVDPRWTPRCPACKASGDLSETRESLGEALTSENTRSGAEIRGRTVEPLPNSPQEGRGGEGIGENSSSEIADAIADPDEAPREDVEHLCAVLADLIEGNDLKRPTIGKKWRDSARLMLDRDKRDPQQAERLIRWALADEFWRTNILSMPKFREKYDQLLARARSTAQRGSNVRPLPSLDGPPRPKPREIDPDAPFQPPPRRFGEENRVR